jgi:hypothetical protein
MTQPTTASPGPGSETSGTAIRDLEPLYYVYGKHSSHRRFLPMNLLKGTRVVDLVYASQLSSDRAREFLQVEAPRSTGWSFELRRIPTAAIEGPPEGGSPGTSTSNHD